MMGFQGTPARLFYDFCLNEHFPFDHTLRASTATSNSMIFANR